MIGDEQPYRFARLRAELLAQYSPVGPVEQALVERLASVLWRLGRVPSFEAAVVNYYLERRREEFFEKLAYLEDESDEKESEGDAAEADGDQLEEPKPDLGGALIDYQRAKESLLTHWPEIDCETLADTLEGITDLHEMIAAVIRSALVDEALHAGLRFRIDDMKERLLRLELRAAKKRQLALEAMSEAALSKIAQPDFTASARAGSPALVVVAEDRIPEALLATPASQA
jgi:hypothetical protein